MIAHNLKSGMHISIIDSTSDEEISDFKIEETPSILSLHFSSNFVVDSENKGKFSLQVSLTGSNSKRSKWDEESYLVVKLVIRTQLNEALEESKSFLILNGPGCCFIA